MRSLLSASDTPGVLSSALHADGRQASILCTPGRVSGGEIAGSPFLKMDGQAVFKQAVHVLEDVAREALAKADRAPADVDWMVPHQANIRIIEALAKRLDFPVEKIIVRIQEYANTSAASIPLALTDALEAGRVKPGMNILTATFGGGLTCGAGIIKWGERTEALARAEITAANFEGNVFDLMQESFNYHGIDVSHLLSGE